MNRAITILNCIGVFALAILCGWQWRQNSLLEHRAGDLDTVRMTQALKLDEQTKSLIADAADMDDLRDRLETADAQLQADQRRIDSDETELAASKARLNQFAAAAKLWKAAVAQRDDALKKIAAQRNDAVNQFNDLVGKYNALVKQIEADQSK